MRQTELHRNSTAHGFVVVTRHRDRPSCVMDMLLGCPSTSQSCRLNVVSSHALRHPMGTRSRDLSPSAE